MRINFKKNCVTFCLKHNFSMLNYLKNDINVVFFADKF